MNTRLSMYGILLLVFAGAVLIGSLVPAESVLREISAVPAIGALVAALFQVLRDQAAHERQLLLLQQQHAFNLGAASHMAGVAFDKHAEFCEKYMAEVHQTIATLFREGPTPLALKHASNLVHLKSQYSAWLTVHMMEGLVPFEAALRRIGANSQLVEALRGTGDPERPKAIQEMYAVFKELMGIGEATPAAGPSEATLEGVQAYLRGILGIEQLTLVRQRLIEQALASVPHGA